MRRNLRNEILMAVGGLAIIICGLVFAILLSDTSNTVDGTAIVESNTDDITVTNTITSDTAIPTEEASETELQPTETESPSGTPELKNTETSSDTPEPTNTEIPSDTPEPTETESPSDTPEPTNTETSSDTPEPTETESPSDTPEPTNTETSSDTPEPTETESPSDTPEPTNTKPPTRTPMHTETATRVNTSSVTATIVTDFTGVIPTLPPSPTVISPDEPTRTPASCLLPQGWTSYRVQLGDTLFAISLVTNSTVDELRFANCINDVDNITAGDTIFVPIAPIRPVSTSVPSGIRGGLSMIGCTSPATQITSPTTAQQVSGTFTVFGTATRPDFQYYKIEVRPDFASIYNFYSDSQSQVNNGVLGQINADLFGPGLHWVRLSIVDLSASIPADAICEIPVIFE